ncbi:tyrosine-type recombinase/integrase [Bacillus cereus group sp. MYBK163-2]|uniref:tyrosine-type recombinase/integrase n=1 Tax=Bacillus cereus group TaxID=86661 RepID=UPI000B4C14D8|nr:tyrosine-type recombinase/integrase [Bacillus cereus]MDA2255143.1 tyrosine-type recombinase/integrase [Bacillus cereus]MDA2505212.1 tyrosine-type recombinase/integrase [Bacillus cereus]TFZ09189.1 integrase [Bacillus cereus]
MLLKFAIKEFLDDRELRNLSFHTVKSYKGILRQFESFCVDKRLFDTHKITTKIAKEFLVYCKYELKNSVSTINAKTRTLKIFFRYLEEEEIAEENPFKKIKFSKEDLVMDVLSDQQVKKVLDYFDRGYFKGSNFALMRNRMVIILLISTGLRREELVNLKWSDVDMKNRTIMTYGKKRSVATIPYTRKLQKELAEYKTFLEFYFEEEEEIVYVFPDKTNRQLSTEAISTLFKRLKKDLKMDGLTCHAFRRYFASKCLKMGMDSLNLQRLMRHETLQMTDRYVKLYGHALHGVNDKYNPLNFINI